MWVLKIDELHLVKKYLSIKISKKGQEITLSSGTGYSGADRFKAGDIHIRKESSYVFKD